MIGNDDAKMSAFKSRIGRTLSAYTKSISGTAVSEPEREFLSKQIPNEKLDDKTFVEKLNDFRRELESVKSRKLETYRRAGYNVDRLISKNTGIQSSRDSSEATSGRSPQADSTAAPANDMVKMQAPNNADGSPGSIGFIPKEKLGQALKRGFKVL
jgi:hypothetical protein